MHTPYLFMYQCINVCIYDCMYECYESKFSDKKTACGSLRGRPTVHDLAE